MPEKQRGEAEVQLQAIRNFGTRRMWVVSTTLRPLYPWEKLVFIVREAEWPSEPV